MKKEDQLNLEILSKIVIQLKTSQVESIKKFNEEVENLKSENGKNMMEIREKYDSEIYQLKDELNLVKTNSKERKKFYFQEISEMKSKFEKTMIELREDMLKLLNKYETRFQTQDEEIEVLKNKCEMADCKICNFQSFKVHFFICEQCTSCVCSDCMEVCKRCRITRCQECLIKGNCCTALLCTECIKRCESCLSSNCGDCFDKCGYCNALMCKKCLKNCRNCEKIYCKKCAAECVKCGESVSCNKCLDKEGINDRCICGSLYCFTCEDDCKECTVPICWDNNSRIFQGFHCKSASVIPTRCMIKFDILHKGIDTSHLGFTSDLELKDSEKATENFWSLCLNSGEKFSTSDYKKKGMPWSKYAVPVKVGDTIYLKFVDGEVKFFINRKEYQTAFLLDKTLKYYVYCLTHDDSTKIEIKSLKVFK
jgi:hypothetical protein